MAIRVVCSQCAKALSAPEAAAGKRARCPACKTVLSIPLPVAELAPDDDVYGVAPSVPAQAEPQPQQPRPLAARESSELPARLQPASPAVRTLNSQQTLAATVAKPAARAGNLAAKPARSAAPHGARNYLYLVFAIALAPLAWSTLIGGEEDFAARLQRTIEAHPEAFDSEDLLTDETSFFGRLPAGRLEGAHLSRSTWVHWLYALLSAAAFLGLIVAAFERHEARPMTIGLVGLGTATAGIVFLLSVQFLAALSQGIWVRGASIVTVIFYLIKLIGFSYNAASDPDNGFLLSFFGYTIGVGLCEEFTKALPVIVRCRNESNLSWRAAVMWGLASGVGFGVAEGILYSSQYYNGLLSGEIYLIRFVSCVALHAVWTAAAALLIWSNQEEFNSIEGWGDLALKVLMVLGVPMVLHGLYDTMLKKEMQPWALLVALLSFVWLAILVEYTRRQEETPSERPLLAASRSIG